MEKVSMESVAVKGLQGSVTTLLGRVGKLFKGKNVTWAQILQALLTTERYVKEMEAIFKPSPK